MAKRVAETPTDYERPYRPLPVALLNAAGRAARHVGASGRLDVDRMVAKAQRRTGLSSFGDEWFMEPLSVLARSINEEADLTLLGRLIQRRRIEEALVTRLRVEELLRRRPEICNIDLGPIVVIAGLQRTGTTTLHRLIASHPEMRAVEAWEGLNPLPLPREEPGDPHTRIRRALIAEKAVAYLAPAFFAVHPAEHDAPEEDVLLLDVAFMSQSAEATMHVPTYARWLEDQDHTRAYEEFRTLLQVLHWQRPRSHWVLKTPHHMEYLDILLEAFPTATVVRTHRDPLKTIPSFCSMVAHGRGLFSDRVDPKEIGAHWFAKTCRLVERTARAREAADPRRFVDVSYYDLVDDPMAVLGKIYERAAIPFGPNARKAAERTASRNVQHRYGRHVYTPESFGLSPEVIEQGMAAYRKRHGIPRE
ncbi:MAG: sulfotransferase [Holophagales bacterium]|nr:sulfotransferase [Holophagales bacterium]MYD23035.1 sulfotransferase [Holophagales bacterium]MYI34400.1 sulfotransferase [Holophagales bacterium]